MEWLGILGLVAMFLVICAVLAAAAPENLPESCTDPDKVMCDQMRYNGYTEEDIQAYMDEIGGEYCEPDIAT